MRKFFILIITLFISISAYSQFGGFAGMGGGTSNNQNTSKPVKYDSAAAAKDFNFKKYFRGLSHKDTLMASWVGLGSFALPGSAQIYNKQYWKLPIIYGGIGGSIYGSIHFNNRYKKFGYEEDKLKRNLFIGGSIFFYWASIMDGVVAYKPRRSHVHGRAALYSTLLPGLGQAFNGDYWKIPIFYGGLATTSFLWYQNDIMYKRYKDLYSKATTEGGEGQLSPENLKYYRDHSRRLRDYSILATALIYILQIVDADVFSTMQDFDISDDLSLGIEPTIISPITIPNHFQQNLAQNTFGIKVKLDF